MIDRRICRGHCATVDDQRRLGMLQIGNRLLRAGCILEAPHAGNEPNPPSGTGLWLSDSVELPCRGSQRELLACDSARYSKYRLQARAGCWACLKSVASVTSLAKWALTHALADPAVFRRSRESPCRPWIASSVRPDRGLAQAARPAPSPAGAKSEGGSTPGPSKGRMAANRRNSGAGRRRPRSGWFQTPLGLPASFRGGCKRIGGGESSHSTRQRQNFSSILLNVGLSKSHPSRSQRCSRSEAPGSLRREQTITNSDARTPKDLVFTNLKPPVRESQFKVLLHYSSKGDNDGFYFVCRIWLPVLSYGDFELLVDPENLSGV